MKVESILGIILILAIHINSQKIPAPGTSCSNTNPFIKQIPAQEVPVYSNPTVSSAVCDFEFETYGTCCDPTQLIAFGHKDLKQIKDDVQRINKEYTAFQAVFPKIDTLIKRIASAPLHPTREDWNNQILKARGYLVQTAAENLLGNLIHSQDASAFIEANNKCWKFQAKVRELALCYTCSGRSDHFFRGEKALISESTCDTFARLCAFPLSDIVRMLKSLPTLFLSNSRTLPTLGIALNINEKIKRSAITDYITLIRSERTDLLIGAHTKISDPEMRHFICKKFFRLREKPLISLLKNMFASELPWVVEAPGIEAYMQEKEHEIKANLLAQESQQKTDASGSKAPQSAVSNWSISRLLQFSGETQVSLVGSDTKIISPSDASYTSVGVSGNSPMDFGHVFP